MVEVFPIEINQGEDFESIQNYVIRTNGVQTPVNLAGCTVEAQIRKKPGANAITLAFTAVVSNAATGEFTLSLTNAQTSSLNVKFPIDAQNANPEYYYDVELTLSGGTKKRLMNGPVIVSAEVTE